MKIRFSRPTASLFVLALLAAWLGIGPAAPVQAGSTVLYVAPASACTGTPNCFATVQAAVDAALTGYEIWVAAGTYTDIHNCPRNDILTTGVAPAVVCLGKTLTIRGGYNTSFTSHDPAAYPTILDAGNLGRDLYITGEVSPAVADLSITRGNAAGLTGYENYGQFDAGGGVYVMTANATLYNLRIYNNTAPYGGGGVYLGFSDSQLTGSSLDHNTAGTAGMGGGAGIFIYEGAPTLGRNEIGYNTTINNGGGVHFYDTDATLIGNTLFSNTAAIGGGGVFVASCNPVFRGNFFSHNSADKGGGMLLWYSNSLLVNNAILDNQADLEGSGLWIGGSAPTLVHNTIARNTGGDGSGVYATGDGGSTYSLVTMTNSIVAGQPLGIFAAASSQVTLDGVLWSGNTVDTGGAGTVSALHAYTGDPAFAGYDSLHLTAGSAAIDKGVGTTVVRDIDGQPRLGTPDLGADEYWAPGYPIYIYLPLVIR